MCPPCEKQCETTCGHSKCCMAPNGESLKTRPTANPRKGKNEKGGRTCGEPCPPCREKCLNHCDHRACTKNCGDICDVEPCMEPCAKPLPCSPKLLPEGHEGFVFSRFVSFEVFFNKQLMRNSAIELLPSGILRTLRRCRSRLKAVK